MNLLVLDTTGPACSVALRVPGRADRVCSEDMVRGQAERLAPMVSEILAEAGLTPQEIDRIGVTTGPGSFAGTRVGVAFARGLALAINAEITGLSNLECWARQSVCEESRTVLAIHDARRGEAVVQLFENCIAQDLPKLIPVEDPGAWLMAFAASHPEASAMTLAGSGAYLFPAVPDQQNKFRTDLSVLMDMAANASPPFAPPRPFYARPPDAKLPGGQELA